MKALPYKISWAVLVLWLFFFALSSPVPAQDKDLNRPLVASGTRPMMEQDSADARKLALEEALRAAVEQGLGWLLPSDRIVRYYPLLLDHILKEPMSYIQDYQIVHEGVTFGLYRVTVLTTLYTEGLNVNCAVLVYFWLPASVPGLRSWLLSAPALRTPGIGGGRLPWRNINSLYFLSHWQSSCLTRVWCH